MEGETPAVEYAFTVLALLDELRQLGSSHEGMRQVYPVIGGTFEGPNIRGEVIPGGGDWQIIRPDGVVDMEAEYSLKVDDGAIVQVRNRGLMQTSLSDILSSAGGKTAERRRLLVRTSAQFVAPPGKHDWLNKFIFVGTVKIPEGRIDRVWVSFFKVI